MRLVLLVTTTLALTACSTQNGNSGNYNSTSSTATATVSANRYETLTVNTGSSPKKLLVITSYYPMGGMAGGFSGNVLVYPDVAIKDMAGNSIPAVKVAQEAVPPGMFTGLSLETKYRVNLKPATSYRVMVKASMTGGSAGARYTRSTSVGSIEVPINVNTSIDHASSGKVEVKLM